MPGSERGRRQDQRGMDAGVGEGWTSGSERDGCWGQRGADARVGEGWMPGSERDRRSQRGTDGVREGWMGSEKDGCWGQRGIDGVREGHQGQKGMDTGVLGHNICAEKGMRSWVQLPGWL